MKSKRFNLRSDRMGRRWEGRKTCNVQQRCFPRKKLFFSLICDWHQFKKKLQKVKSNSFSLRLNTLHLHLHLHVILHQLFIFSIESVQSVWKKNAIYFGSDDLFHQKLFKRILVCLLCVLALATVPQMSFNRMRNWFITVSRWCARKNF